MNPILIAIFSVTGIGLLCGLMLAVASKVMAVKTDERFPAVRECLPGANCGACGYPGCDGYAKALVEDAGVKANLCVPGGDSVSHKLSDTLGVAFEDVVEEVAFIACNGDCNATKDKMDYQGIESCQAAKLLFGGFGTCTFGCIGLGDCAKACPNGAICLENGIAHIDTRECTGCGICTRTCPNHLISVMPDIERVLVTCKNTEKGAVTRSKCASGCIGCKKCEKACPIGAVTVINNLAVIDYAKCPGCGDICASARVCPTGCIKTADFRGINSIPQA